MLEDIKKNIERLIALYEGEKQEKSNLLLRLNESEAKNETYRKQITDLEREVDNLKLAEAFAASSDNNSEAKEKVEKLIREINKCISLLSR